MSYARIKTWIVEVLTASDLNAEFNGCIANDNDLRTDLDAEVTARGAALSNIAYDPTSWDGVTTIAPSKNAVRDKIELMVAAAAARGHIGGLQLSNDTDTEHDILVAVGEATDSTGAIQMKLDTAITKQIDNTWVAGDDAGGLNDAEHPISGGPDCFHVFLLSDATGVGTVDVGFDTDIDATNLLADAAVVIAELTLYRRIGSVLVDSDENILQFIQEGDEFLWKDPPLDIDVATQGSTAASRTLSVPTDIKVHAIINIYTENAATLATVYLSPLDVDDEAASLSAAPLASLKAEAISTSELDGPKEIRTNTSGQIRSVAININTTIKIATLGWIDRRGKDD